MKFKEASSAALKQVLSERLTVSAYEAGRALSWGRRATDTAIRMGALPIIDGPRPQVSTEWLKRQLQITES